MFVGGAYLNYIIQSKKRNFIFFYLFALLVLIYAITDFQSSRNVAGVVGERGPVHITLFLIIFVLGLYYISSIVANGIYFSAEKVILWIITLWILVVNLITNTDRWNMAIHIGLSCLWILTHHYFSSYLRRWNNALPRIQLFISVMFLFYVFSALYASYNLRVYLAERGHDQFAVVNLAYNVLVFLPWVWMFKRQKIRQAASLLIFLVIAVSMKRGAIVVFPLMFGAAIVIDSIVKKQGLSRPLLKTFFFIVLFIIGLLIADHLSGGFLSKRFETDNLMEGSGRAHSYKEGIEKINMRSPVAWISGEGSGTTLRYFGTGAHNEWIEFALNFGFIGVLFYSLLLLFLSLKSFKLTIRRSRYASAYAIVLINFSVIGIYSGVYFMHSTFYLMALLGAVEGLEYRRKEMSNRAIQGNSSTVPKFDYLHRK